MDLDSIIRLTLRIFFINPFILLLCLLLRVVEAMRPTSRLVLLFHAVTLTRNDRLQANRQNLLTILMMTSVTLLRVVVMHLWTHLIRPLKTKL